MNTIIFYIALCVSLALNYIGLKNVDIDFYGLLVLVFLVAIILGRSMPFTSVILATLTIGLLHEFTRHAFDFWWGYDTLSDNETYVNADIKLMSDLLTIAAILVISSIAYFLMHLLISSGTKKKIKNQNSERTTPLEYTSAALGYGLIIIALPFSFFKEEFNIEFSGTLAISLILSLVGIATGFASLLKRRNTTFISNLGLIINGYTLLVCSLLRMTQ